MLLEMVAFFCFQKSSQKFDILFLLCKLKYTYLLFINLIICENLILYKILQKILSIKGGVGIKQMVENGEKQIEEALSFTAPSFATPVGCYVKECI